MKKQILTNNESFKSPHTLKNKILRLVWSLTYYLFYRWTPSRLGMPWRRQVLRIFGAKIGRSWIHPSTRIWAPWMLSVGNASYIDEYCYLYNPYRITISDRVIISFGSVLCTPSHDYNSRTYNLIGNPIFLEDDTWLMAQVFVCPGVTIESGAVVAARSVVTKAVPKLAVVGGNPAKFIKMRNLNA